MGASTYGAALVADSDVEAEYTETLDKIRHLMKALADPKHDME